MPLKKYSFCSSPKLDSTAFSKSSFDENQRSLVCVFLNFGKRK